MRHMYDKVAMMIPRTAPVVDLGCGNGYLASALQMAKYEGQYVGYDFSPVAVDMAISALTIDNPQMALFKIEQYPQYQFEVADLYDLHHEIHNETHSTIYTCFEVLEHVPDDCAIVDRLPARSRFIFSVPNFWSGSHVRAYDSVGTAINRFSESLRFVEWRLFTTKQPEAAIHLYDTIRRADKW